jgi:hypothetical protein
MATVCPNCGRAIKEIDPKICPYCGSLVGAVPTTETRALDETEMDEDGVTRLGTSHFGRTMLLIEVRDSGEKFLIDPEQVDTLVLGRRDPFTGELPDIDLERFNALDQGVSRKHATIVRRGTSLQIVDSGTPNGSFLNGQKLIPDQPRILRDGDQVRLGKLVLHVSFIESPESGAT